MNKPELCFCFCYLDHMIGDWSLRFLKYVLSMGPKIASVTSIDSSTCYPDLKDVITYSCYTPKGYVTQRRLRSRAGPPLAELSELHQEESVRRLLMPKHWTAADENVLVSLLFTNPKVKFIAFPIVCVNTEAVCTDVKSSSPKHMVIMVYNKARKDIEIWDDKYGVTQSSFGIYRLYHSIIETYLMPTLTEMGFEFSTEDVTVPYMSEIVYGKIKKALQADKRANNYEACYSAFLIDYIKRRIANPNGTPSNMYKKVDCTAVPGVLDELQDFNIDWWVKHRCPPMKLFNPGTGRCIQSRSTNARKIAAARIEETDACPYPQLRNIATGHCKDIIIHQHVVEDAKAFPIHIHDRWMALMSYFIQTYPYLATAGDNKFRWHITDGGEWVLSKPRSFDKVMKRGMSNSTVTHIVFFIHLTDKSGQHGHMNCLIVDKTTKTVERYEPNEPVAWSKYNNGDDLDDAIAKIFAVYGLTGISMSATCPIGFHDLEAMEDSAGLKNYAEFGGNCAVWSLWYMNLRIANPFIPHEELVKGTWKILAKEGALKHFINGYHAHLIKVTAPPPKTPKVKK